jgi:hypothetical protein
VLSKNAKPSAKAALSRKLATLKRRHVDGTLALHEATALCYDAGQDPPQWAMLASAGGTRLPLGEEKAELERLHRRHQDGNGWALFQTLEFCFVRAFGMPGWAVGALLAGMGRYQRGAAAELGEAFGVPRKAGRKKPFAGELFPLKGVGYVLVPLDEYVLSSYPALKRTGQQGESPSELVATEIRKNLDHVGSKVTAPTARAIETAWRARSKGNP